jgi:hypothetical protein
MHQAIIHRAEQLFTSPSKASMMGHFGGVLGEWVGVQEGGLGFPLPHTPDFVIQLSRAPSFGCKMGNPNCELTCIGMTQKNPIVLLS